MNQSEISALINLLDDPDKEVYKHVSEKLLAFGSEVIPDLESAWEKTFDPVLHRRIENLIHSIQSNSTGKYLKEWIGINSDNLLEGTLIISRYQYPDLKTENVLKAIDKLKKSIWLEMNYDLTPLEQVNVFNHVFYSLQSFSGNTLNLLDPQNCYINHVLESKKGNSISLGILYLVLAHELKMPVYGVNLPEHFILSYHKDFITLESTNNEVRRSVLFYINPFNKGMIFTKEDIALFLKRLNIEPDPQYYIPCDNKTIIKTLIENLIQTYKASGVNDKVNELEKLLGLF
jgi:regulator of sirC expression with transglutaminase-like and TPR domain